MEAVAYVTFKAGSSFNAEKFFSLSNVKSIFDGNMYREMTTVM